MEILKEYFHYDPETGLLVLLKSTARRTSKGDVCGSLNSDGYLKVHFRGSSYAVHRIAYKLHTGEEPPSNIDHLNGNRSDNRWCNLDGPNHVGNAGRRISSLGYIKRRNKFVSYITFNGVRRNIKYCGCETSARVSYLQEKIKLGFDMRDIINGPHLKSGKLTGKFGR